MISDALVYVVCDKCKVVNEFWLEWRYSDYTGNKGYYYHSEKSVEKLLKKEGWVVKDGKHYCCPECLDNPNKI